MSDEAVEPTGTVPQEQTPDRKAVTKSQWVKNAVHYPMLPSGSVVGMRIPDLPALVESGDIPNHLLDAALAAAGAGEDQTPSKEMIVKQREFTDILVEKSVVEPKVSADDAKNVPYEDKEMIVAIATRQRDLDAEGQHIAGLTKSEKFRRFRRLGEFDPLLESF